jgi:hypothetical protein
MTARNATAVLGDRLDRVENFPRAAMLDAFGFRAYRLAQPLPSNLQRSPQEVDALRKRGVGIWWRRPTR